MKIRIITVGKISKPYREIFEDYRKRLRGKIQLEHVQLQTGGDLNRENPEVVKRREAKKISRYLIGRRVLLDIRGEMLDSKGFSKFLNFKTITFVIGGPLGIGDELLDEFDEILSLSKLTLSHEVAFVVLLEQLFRSYKIIRGERYHY